MTVFANFAALVADQTGTTLTQADADLLEVILDSLLSLDGRNIGPMLKEALTITDVDGAVDGESRVLIVNASDNLRLDIIVLAGSKVETRFEKNDGSGYRRIQRTTEDAVFTYVP